MSLGVNSAIAAPSGWGKTALLQEAARRFLARDPTAIVCAVDLSAVRSEPDFYNRLAASLLASVHLSPETIRELLPGIVTEASGVRQIELGSSNPVQSNLIDLPERLSTLNKFRFVIILEPFDTLISVTGPLFQSHCRRAWQQHRAVSYCLEGGPSMESFLTRRESPFYKFCELLLLRKISRDVLVRHLVKSFAAIGKSIPNSVADHLCNLVNDHTRYVEELTQAILLRPEREISREHVDQTMVETVHHHAHHFRTALRHLSDTQINLLRAVISGVERYTSVAAMNRFGMGTPRNVVKNREALIRGGLISNLGRKLMVVDPLLAHWLKTVL